MPSPQRLNCCSATKTALAACSSGYSRPGLPYQVLEVKSLTGGIDVTATLVGSGGPLLNAASDTVLLQLVEDSVVEPDNLDLFQCSITLLPQG